MLTFCGALPDGRALTFAISATEVHAQSLGWPSKGSQRRVAQIAREINPDLSISVVEELADTDGDLFQDLV